ncbi:MAG TPA: diguanylate cyclase [Myxococcota bacterium]|jgi:diguanylate cyclase (GGDEF)-like protein|nr:diguanylate cyclase [Myxococcota bacterium]
MATILLVDDSGVQRAEIRRAVEASGVFDRIVEAADGLEGLKRLLTEDIDVVLCDLEMPGLDGEKLLRVKEARGGVGETPFLFLTASPDPARRARLLEHGASDAITKPFDAFDLVARLRLQLKVKRLQDELREKNRMLEEASTTDCVTGLRSRRYVSEVLERELSRARRHRTPLSILMADLDHFKSVNDRFGHPAGDAVLRGAADLLREGLRKSDVAGRVGGEEFLVILPQTDRVGGRMAAERWQKPLAGTPLALPSGDTVRVTVSIGVAQLETHMETSGALVQAADAALYAAKKNGRNRIEVAGE